MASRHRAPSIQGMLRRRRDRTASRCRKLLRCRCAPCQGHCPGSHKQALSGCRHHHVCSGNDTRSCSSHAQVLTQKKNSPASLTRVQCRLDTRAALHDHFNSLLRPPLLARVQPQSKKFAPKLLQNTPTRSHAQTPANHSRARHIPGCRKTTVQVAMADAAAHTSCKTPDYHPHATPAQPSPVNPDQCRHS